MGAPPIAAPAARYLAHGFRFLLILTCLALAPVAAVADVDIKAIRAAEHPDYTRLVVDLSGPAEYRLVRDENGRTLFLDIRDARVAGPLSHKLLAGTPILTVVKSPLALEKGIRLRISLSDALRAKTFALKPYLQRGHRIVIDLYPRQSTAEGDTADPAGIPPAAPERTPVPPEASGMHASETPRQDRESRLHFGATWEHEWGLGAGDGDAQKFESIFQPELQLELPADMRLTVIGQLRADTVGELGPDASRPPNYSSVNGPWTNDAHFGLDLREFYIDAHSGGVLWRLGKQQVVWGEADGIKVMDVVNPQSFREFILDEFDDSRIPLWTVNAEVLVGDAGSLQLLWIPDTTYHELAEAGTPFEVTSPLLVPRAPGSLPVQIDTADRPDDPFRDSDAGMRFATFAGGWDFTVNYLYHYQDFPVPYQKLVNSENGAVGLLTPEYERNHLAGATASNVFGPLTLRTEFVYNSDTFHVSSARARRGIEKSDEISSVLGLDWRWESQETLLSFQWFQSHLLNFTPEIFRSETEHTLSLLYRRDFDYDTWNLMALGLYSVDRGDRWLQVRLTHLFTSNLELWLGGDFFAGDEDGLFGQFSSRDRVLLGMEYGF